MPAARSRPVTMADVAREAGVSRTAVSLVLNEREDVAIPAPTRERIVEAATALGYRPNAAARGLARQRSGWFGLVTEIVTAPYAVDVIRGAQQRAWADERFLLIAPSEDELTMEAGAIERLLEQRVEGLIIAATWHRPIVVPPNAHDVPCVLVNCYDADGVLPSIVPDEVGGGRTAARALLDAGHDRIGHITLARGIPAQVGRLGGFRAELATEGVALADDLIVEGDGNAESGYRGAAALLDRRDRPTAIFCGNDRMAMGAYDAAKERGLSIPHDLSIVGFDDQELLAAYLRPGLTTVALPFEEMGARGVSMLTSWTAGSAIPDLKVEIDCPLHIRSSVGLALR
ncbi:MAG: LacI family DNA-binding transcriptional regulator [Microbacterium sp.]